VVVAKDILRKYPGKYENLIKDLAKKNNEYFEVEAKASIIWIVGEYAEKIENSLEIIQGYQ
jgi:vesicle coat complex subunit